MQLGEGVRLGDRYVLGPVLGAGGTAHVYRAFDERLGVPVAVKVLSLANPVARDRLKQEATVQASLRHPHIVSVTDVLDVDGWPAVVMELVDGPTLGDLIDAGPLPPEEAVELFRGILEGVAAAHGAGTVHRDLKPGNVLVAKVGRRRDPGSVPLDEAFVEEMIAEPPDHALPWILAVNACRGHGRFDDADAMGRRALEAGQGSGWLLSELAINALQRGRHQEAVDYGVRSLQVEPGSWPPRLHAAMGAAHLGDMETFDRLVAPMRGDEFPVAGRRRFAFFVARGLATLGQLERSAEWASIARRAAEGSDAQQTPVRIAAMEVEMRLHPWVSDDTSLADRLAVALTRAADRPARRCRAATPWWMPRCGRGSAPRPTSPALWRPARSTPAPRRMPSPSPSPRPSVRCWGRGARATGSTSPGLRPTPVCRSWSVWMPPEGHSSLGSTTECTPSMISPVERMITMTA